MNKLVEKIKKWWWAIAILWTILVFIVANSFKLGQEYQGQKAVDARQDAALVEMKDTIAGVDKKVTGIAGDVSRMNGKLDVMLQLQMRQGLTGYHERGRSELEVASK